MSAPLLSVVGLCKRFRGLRAVSDVHFEVPQAAIVALIGPNGAGKTTCFNLISGMLRPDQGRVHLSGREITGLRPDRVCHAGIGRTFQLVKPFAGLSVLDNVTVGALKVTADVAAARAAAEAILELTELADRRHQPAASLSLPNRKRLELARALATRPRLLLLDEVMAGLRPVETDRLVAMLADLNRRTGLAILLIEHVMRAVMALSQSVVVLNHGEKICEGTPQEVTSDARVLECYLGEEPT